MVPGTLGVREINEVIRRATELLFEEEIWVRGVISGLNRSQAGHVYFQLVEPGELGQRPDAVLPVTLFAGNKVRVNAMLREGIAPESRVRMDDGIEIRIRGSLRYYPPQARMQLIMTAIDPAFTLGQLDVAKAALIAALTNEGLIDANRAQEWPLLPLRIALVTSPGSAAEADFIQELAQSGFRFHVKRFPSRVQGTDAAYELAEAIGAAAASDVDVVAVIRGGGARTDLVAFDHEAVARAIATARRPVIVGIGHEIDQSVADRVAHHSAKTPTACARMLIDFVTDFADRVTLAQQRLHHATRALVSAHNHRLALAISQLDRLAGAAVARQHGLLSVASHRLQTGSHHALRRESERLVHHRRTVGAYDPDRMLARGWSITRNASGELITSVAHITAGTRLVTTVGDGVIVSDTPGSAAGRTESGEDHD